MVSMEKKPSNQLDEKNKNVEREEVSAKEWVTRLRQTGGNIVSKPEVVKKIAILSDIHTSEEMFYGDPNIIDVTPEFLKNLLAG